MARARRIGVARILDDAADLLEEHGWVTNSCYNSTTGGMCALGAIGAAVYPEVLADNPGDLNALAYISNDRRHAANQVEAVKFFAEFVKIPRAFDRGPDQEVYYFNDGIDSHSPKSADQVVAKLREAAGVYREQRKAKTAA